MQYINSLINHKNDFQLEKELSSDQLCTYNGKTYRYIGKSALQRSFCWWVQRIAIITVLALATLCTLGLILILPAFREKIKQLKLDITAKVNCYALHNLQNWCLVRQTCKIDLNKKFSIKKFWDESLQNQWWNCKLDIQTIQKIHDRLLIGREVPSLIGKTPYANTVATMQGTALLAHYIKCKTGQKDLYVCKNLDAFKEELERIRDNSEDQRAAYVVPTYCDDVNSNKLAGVFQHAYCLCIEKINGKLKIAGLNSQPGPVRLENCHLNPGRFTTSELLLGYVKAANLPNDTQFYTCVPGDHRQFGDEGVCATFALRDAITFLKDSAFFQNFEKGSGQGSISDPFLLKRFPPEFMKGTQSLTVLEKYFSENREAAEKPLGSSGKNLIERVDHHCLIRDSKKQNLFMSRRYRKYHLILLFLLNRLKDSHLNELINKNLIVSKT